MTMDRTSKILLGAIAVGLWANLATTLMNPPAATAQINPQRNPQDTNAILHNIDDNIRALIRGTGACINTKLC
jgi:hypothetical protein